MYLTFCLNVFIYIIVRYLLPLCYWSLLLIIISAPYTYLLMRDIFQKWSRQTDRNVETLTVLHAEDERSLWLIRSVKRSSFDQEGWMEAYSYFITLIHFLIQHIAAIHRPFVSATELQGKAMTYEEVVTVLCVAFYKRQFSDGLRWTAWHQ